MQDLQFHHDNNKFFSSRTFAVGVPNKDEMLAAVNLFMSGMETDMTLTFGVAKVHSDDIYCKATGRDVSYKNAKKHTFRVNKVSIESNGVYSIVLTDSEYELEFHFKLDRPRVFFVDVKELSMYNY